MPERTAIRRHRAGVAGRRRGVATDRVDRAQLPARALPRQLPPRSRPPLPAPGARSARSSRRSTVEFEAFLPRRGRPGRDRPHRRVPRGTCSTGCAARRLRDEDPDAVRRARLHQRRVQPGDDAPRQPLRQPRLRCSPRTSRSACPSRSSSSGPRSRSRSTCRAAPRARSPPSPSPSPTWARTRRASPPPRPDRRRQRLRPQRHQAVDHQRHASPSCWWSWRSIPRRRKISAFVVETDWPGVSVEHRCHFMGLRRHLQRRAAASTTSGSPPRT